MQVLVGAICTKKLIINDIIVNSDEKKIKVRCTGTSDLFSIFLILKFFLKNSSNVDNCFVILRDEKGGLLYKRESIQRLRLFDLNSFLNHYDKILLRKDGDTKIFSEDGLFNIVGWDFVLIEESFLTEDDVNLIKEKVEGYWLVSMRKRYEI